MSAIAHPRARARRPQAARRAAAAAPHATTRLPAALAAVLVVLCVTGLVMVGSSSSVVSIVDYGSSWAIEARECLFMAVGVLAFLGGCRLTPLSLQRLTPIVLLLSVVALALVLAPGFGASSNGAARWLSFAGLQLQPSEFAKLALCLFAAGSIARKERTESRWGRVLTPVAIVTMVLAVLVVAQPDLGTAIVLTAIALAVALAAGAPWKLLFASVGAILGAVALAGVAMPYRRARLLSFLDPNSNLLGAGYQQHQAQVGIGSGGLAGLGLGNSREKWGFLPNPHTDFIFAIIGEELGLFGGLLVLALLVGLVFLALRVAKVAPSRTEQLLAVGIAAWLATETVVNVGAVVGVLPVTGIPLPFISFGGTSLICEMAAVGILVGIARRAAQQPELRVVGAPRPRQGR